MVIDNPPIYIPINPEPSPEDKLEMLGKNPDLMGGDVMTAYCWNKINELEAKLKVAREALQNVKKGKSK